MSGRTRKFAQLSPQKQRQSPAKFVKLTEHDDFEEKRLAAANNIAKVNERAKSIVSASSARRGSGLHGSPSTPEKQTRHDSGVMLNSPAIKMPILANFEEWMKMATDNKINAGNSWNFALIDYFHEMSLLKEGDSINFQKASVTLDGCVKIYTNRVDSVATETGKLLSGLSTNKTAQDRDDGAQNEDGAENGDEDDDGEEVQRTRKKSSKTSSGGTLVKDFSVIQAKKLDMEFFVDPLFKKTSAEFDEGGAKGLLLNHLCVDQEGRIIFDASDASNDVTTTAAEEEEQKDSPDTEASIEALGARFFPELFAEEDDTFEQLHICPFLRNFQSDSAILDIPLHSNIADSDASPVLQQDAFDQDNDEEQDGAILQDVVDVYDDNEHAAFGEVDLELPGQALHMMKPESVLHSIQVSGQDSGSAIGFNLETESMYSHFDALMNKNWTGPANWKISRLNANAAIATAASIKKPRKEKEVSTIDFFSTDNEVDEDIIFTSGGASINLPKTQWSSKNRNLLPEDKHFNSESLLSLFLKPTVKIGTRRSTIKKEGSATDLAPQPLEMDEKFWAKCQEDAAAPDVADTGYDVNFFNDDNGPDADNDDDDDREAFVDAKQEFPNEPAHANDFGSLLQNLGGRKAKPEYVNYAKAAKKVDVKILKENIWDKLALTSVTDKDTPSQEPEARDGGSRKFTSVVQSLADVYPTSAMSEISTSFCFICLLHLANEKGLEITTDPGMRDLTVRRDDTVLAIESV